MSRLERVVAGSLVGLIVSLLPIGVVSATPIRHAIQVVPAVLALMAVVRRWTAAPYTALAIFLFWLLIMVAVWLFLLGIAKIVSGHFTP